MAKRDNRKKNTSGRGASQASGKPGSKRKPAFSWKQLAAVLFVILLLVFSFASFFNRRQSQTQQSMSVEEPRFVKEGELRFIDAETDSTISRIDIEVAATDAERAQGLMYRRYMPESQGMLFIFSREEEQGFYMRNTLITLDLIYVNSQREIVTIHRRAQPLSEVTIYSEKPAQYVVEVVGGYCTKYGIEEGDRIAFERTDIQD
jgi:uncharacterized membrane protein (UPF0127 family)